MIHFMDKDGRDLLQNRSHVGDGAIDLREVGPVEYAQADNAELVAACRILGRPAADMRVWRWVGDDARTIAANWR